MNQVENLSLAVAGFSTVKKALNQTLREAATAGITEKVQRPRTLDKTYKLRRQLAEAIVQRNTQLKGEIQRRARACQVQSDGTIDALESQDLAIRSLLLQSTLREYGALYGDKEFNFCMSDVYVPKGTTKNVEDRALEAFMVLKQLPNASFLNEVEQYIERFGFAPNGARVDVILTGEGPRVIEINTQWIDAIQALEAFQWAYNGQPRNNAPVKTLGGLYKGKRLGILELAQGSGGRSLGARLELDKLSQSLKGKNMVSEAEVINPAIIRPEYLRTFDGFYVNGEPKMFRECIPDWLPIVLSKEQVFPRWRPSSDKKTNLVQASKQSSLFAPTSMLSAESMRQDNNERLVVKGDGYSSNNVYVDPSPEDIDYLLGLPTDYIVQPYLTSLPIEPVFVFDTSGNRVRFMQSPRSKWNVWIVNNQVVGSMLSISDNEVISDKDFNVIPKEK